MSKKESLVPEFRFPEFKVDGVWILKPLNEIGEIITGKTPSTKDKSLWGGDILFITPTDIDEDNKYQTATNRKVKLSKKMKVLPIGSIAYTCIASIGKITITAKKSITNQQINSIVTYGSYNNEFIYYGLINLTPKIKSVPATSTLPIINKTEFSKFEIPIPKKPKEQQKIAQCLSSLDELIQAHTNKREALKDHKKGLLQNLFPQEGQKAPNYRFPEFKKDREWEIPLFSDYIKLYRGSSPRPISKYRTSDETGVNWIKIGDTKNAINYVIDNVEERITPEGAKKSRKVRKGELILANSMSYGNTYLLNLDGYIYDGWFVLREYDKYFDRSFLLQILNSYFVQSQYSKNAAGGIVQNISSDIVYGVHLPKPEKKEQQKIAESLSYLDDLITAQTQKIEQLQDHKIGLMQKLFPKVKS